MSIRLQLETEDKEMAALLLWLGKRESMALDGKVMLLERTAHWLRLADPVQHPSVESFPLITLDVDGLPLSTSTLSGKRLQSVRGMLSSDREEVEGLKPIPSAPLAS